MALYPREKMTIHLGAEKEDEENQFRKLKTGQYITIEKSLPEIKIQRLLRIADQRFKKVSDRPLYIADEITLGDSVEKRHQLSGALAMLKKAKNLLQTNIGDEIAIIRQKTLLRRTWPMSEDHSRKLGHNASNLTWHQDSNPKHGNRAMIVLMASLQDGFGEQIPGLSIHNLEVNSFKGIYGYDGKKVEIFEKQAKEVDKNSQIKRPRLNRGDMIIFDGLTFHRTYATETMTSPRDALLVRVVKPKDTQNFGELQHIKLNIKKL